MENAFIGKASPPTEAELAAALGPAKDLWEELISALESQQLVEVREWNSYSPKAGWALRLKHGKRAIVYLSPCRGCFLASFALGDRANAAARESGLPKPVITLIDQAKRYAEGTAVRIEVKRPKDVRIVTKLAGIKREY